MLIFSTDKKRLHRHFKKDPVLFGYHLGDLDDFYFEDCEWVVDYTDRAHINEVILIYSGLDVPVVLAFGLTERFQPLLVQAMDLFPDKFYGHFQDSSRPLIKKRYNETALGTFYKFKLDSFRKVTDREKKKHIIQLGPSHTEELQAFYKESYPESHFSPRMLDTGKFYAFTSRDRIVSVAGVHVDSEKYKIAVLGSIATAEDNRGKGLSQLVVSQLVDELLKEDKLVCLNVKADNDPAIHCYEKLGFVRTHEFEESLFRQK